MSWRLLARCVRGCEWVLAAELAATVPDARKLRLGHREVRLTVSEVDSLPVPATADDVFLVVARVPDPGRGKDTVAPAVAALAAADWAAPLAVLRSRRPIGPDARFDVVASFTGKRNFNRYAVEDAAGAALAPRLGLAHASRTAGSAGPTDVTVRVFLDGESATAALRLGPAPAHRRDYKRDTAAGTLHPPVAAALARLAGVAAGDRVLDPFCGDGTLAIEAALATVAAVPLPGATVLAADRDPDRVANTTRNAARAATPITVLRADAGALPVRAGTVDVLLANPPWNLAVTATGRLGASLDPFWTAVPRLLAPGGRLAVIADDELGAPDAIRRAGLAIGLDVRVRLAGRVSRLLLAGHTAPALTPDLARWRDTTRRAGLGGDTDF